MIGLWCMIGSMKTLNAIALFLTLSAGSAASALETAQEIEDCVRDNLPEQSSTQEVVFKAYDRTGAVKETRATVYWRESEDGMSKVMMRVSDPPRLRGAGVLTVEKETKTDRFLYLPALRKVRRITKSTHSGALLGTDFTYEELERVQGLRQDGQKERLEDAVLDGRPVYVLEVHPDAEEDSKYDHIHLHIDRETCVVLRSEFYARGDQLRKVLTVDPERVTREDGALIPRHLHMEDLIDESSTDLVVESIEVGASIPDKVFTRKELIVGRR